MKRPSFLCHHCRKITFQALKSELEAKTGKLVQFRNPVKYRETQAATARARRAKLKAEKGKI